MHQEGQRVFSINAFVCACMRVCIQLFVRPLDKWTNEGKMAAGGGLPGSE